MQIEDPTAVGTIKETKTFKKELRHITSEKLIQKMQQNIDYLQLTLWDKTKRWASRETNEAFLNEKLKRRILILSNI